MSEIWSTAKARFEKLTRKRLQQSSADSLQGLIQGYSLKNLDAEKVKRAGLRLAKCLQLLGGVVARAASLVGVTLSRIYTSRANSDELGRSAS